MLVDVLPGAADGARLGSLLGQHETPACETNVEEMIEKVSIVLTKPSRAMCEREGVEGASLRTPRMGWEGSRAGKREEVK